jgi:hypothetical protein
LEGDGLAINEGNENQAYLLNAFVDNVLAQSKAFKAVAEDRTLNAMRACKEPGDADGKE